MTAAASIEELIERCDAVAFAVPPNIQAEVAAQVAAAGRPVLLDKPIGMTVPQADQLAGVIAKAGVISQVVLTNRYLPAMRQFLTESAGFVAHGGSATFLGGGAMEGHFFGTPWRLEQGGLIDLGPHVLDALDAALGTIIDVSAVGDPFGTVVLNCRHASGVVSSAVMSGTTPVEPSGLRIELYGRGGRLSLDTAWDDQAEAGRQFGAAMARIASEFAHADPDLLARLEGAFDATTIPVACGSSWTTDAPFRETADAIAAAAAMGLSAVEMEAAALYAFATAQMRRVLCFAHVTNQMARIEGDFEKGDADGSTDALSVIVAAARAVLSSV